MLTEFFNADPGLGMSMSGGGDMPEVVLDALSKALEIGYGTDSAQFTGGRALQVQSLDTTMQATIATEDKMTLFRMLPKPKVGATVDEWTEQSGVGGVLGGSTNTETGTISEAVGEYARRVGFVRYLTTKRSVSLVASITNNIVDAEAVEERNGAIQLLQDANWLCYTGDSTVVPTEFDGLEAQMRAGVAAGRVAGDHIINMKADPLNSIEPFTRANAIVTDFENFGTATDVFWPNDVQADIDASLDPAYRVSLNGNANDVKLGAPVTGINLSDGVVKPHKDIFIPYKRLTMPFQARGGGYAAVAATLAGLAPASVSYAVTSNADTDFASGHAGNYYYAVCGVNAKGESTGVISAQQAVAAGQIVTITITPSVGGQETGYAIYRGRKNGTNALSDMRLMLRVPKTVTTTVYVDRNRRIPGTTKAFMLNMKKSDTAILWRQLLPMFKFRLFPQDQLVLPWAQVLMGYLRLSKLRHHIMFENILPSKADWKPFG